MKTSYYIQKPEKKICPVVTSSDTSKLNCMKHKLPWVIERCVCVFLFNRNIQTDLDFHPNALTQQ